MGKKLPEEEKIDPIQDEEEIKKRNQKIAIGVIIAVVLVIIGLIIWPLVNKGTLVFNTNNINSTLTYCQLSSLQEDELSPHRGGCPKRFYQNKISINKPSTKLTLPAGNYYLYFYQDSFAPVESSAVIKFGQGTEVSIDLLPLVSKYIDDYTADISTNPNTPYIIKYVSGYTDPENNEGYFEKYIIEDINNPTNPVMELTGFEDIIETNWAPDNTKFFMTATTQGDESATEKKYLVNITDRTITASNLIYENFAWSADSQHIFYISQDIQVDPNFIPPSPEEAPHGFVTPYIKGPSHNSLTQANPDGSDWKNFIKLDVATFNSPDIYPSPDGKNILLIPQNQLAYIYNFTTNEITRYTDLYNIYSASWSPDSQMILLETYYANQPTLYISGLSNQKYTKTNVHSFINKVTWKDAQTLLLTAPNYIPGPDDIPYNPIDIVKKINFNLTSDGEIEYQVNPILESSPTINNAVKLLYNQKQNTLYLLDYENYLNVLPLG